MNHGIKPVRLKERRHCAAIAQISVNKWDGLPRQLGHALQTLLTRVGQVVDHHNAKAGCDQFKNGMGTDVTSPPSDQDLYGLTLFYHKSNDSASAMARRSKTSGRHVSVIQGR